MPDSTRDHIPQVNLGISLIVMFTASGQGPPIGTERQADERPMVQDMPEGARGYVPQVDPGGPISTSQGLAVGTERQA